MALKWRPVAVGMFTPDMATAKYKSTNRFMRIVSSVPELYRALTTGERAGDIKDVGEGNVLTREMGASTFMFLWTTCGVSTQIAPHGHCHAR